MMIERTRKVVDRKTETPKDRELHLQKLNEVRAEIWFPRIPVNLDVTYDEIKDREDYTVTAETFVKEEE